MARFPKPAEGSWTEHYPQLGTELVSYEDSISPEFYEVERKAVFKRAVPGHYEISLRMEGIGSARVEVKIAAGENIVDVRLE